MSEKEAPADKVYAHLGDLEPARGLPVKPTLSTTSHIAIWLALSVCLTFFNKYILTGLGYHYPITLTGFHMLIAAIGSRVMGSGANEFDIPVHLSWHAWSRTILPISGLFSASLVLSGLALVHLDVGVLQMTKSLIPIAVVAIQLALGLQGYTHLLMLCVVLASGGGLTAAQGATGASLAGLLFQSGAILVCAALICCLIPFTEGTAPFTNVQKVGIAPLLANAAIACGLNVASMSVIRAAGSLTLTLSGYIKDVTIIGISVLVLGMPISVAQVIGYTLALTGVGIYRMTDGDPALVAQLCQALWGYFVAKLFPRRTS